MPLHITEEMRNLQVSDKAKCFYYYMCEKQHEAVTEQQQQGRSLPQIRVIDTDKERFRRIWNLSEDRMGDIINELRNRNLVS